MKRLVALISFAALLAGCGDNEAKRFGYKGADLEESYPMFFTANPTVTNWVPSRVLTVCEDYEYTADELRLIADAGVISPCDPLDKIPEGYTKDTDEPWFATWTKPAENFGVKGVNGFISHFNEDRNQWDTSETYFSSYYASGEEAEAAMVRLQDVIAKGYAPKKIYKFNRSFIAEYVRLRVMVLVGQKADGTWSCMLDIQDKTRSGCGQWEPIEEQAERLREYKYRKAVYAWRKECERLVQANHEYITKRCEKVGIPLFGADVKLIDFADGRRGYYLTGEFDMAGVDSGAKWTELSTELETATGVTFRGAPTVEEYAEMPVKVWSASATNLLFEVRLDVVFESPAEKTVIAPEENADAPVEGASDPVMGRWRKMCIERTQKGYELPEHPMR